MLSKSCLLANGFRKINFIKLNIEYLELKPTKFHSENIRSSNEDFFLLKFYFFEFAMIKMFIFIEFHFLYTFVLGQPSKTFQKYPKKYRMF